jgi:hypothetical protein
MIAPFKLNDREPYPSTRFGEIKPLVPACVNENETMGMR